MTKSVHANFVMLFAYEDKYIYLYKCVKLSHPAVSGPDGKVLYTCEKTTHPCLFVSDFDLV